MPQLPPFLNTYGDLQAHFEAHYDGLEGTARGAAFLDFAQQLIPFTDVGSRFEGLEPSATVSHDHGVDMTTRVNDYGDQLCVQAKFKVYGKDDLDTVFSKFHHYEKRELGQEEQQARLFDDDAETSSELVFMLITTTSLTSQLDSFERSRMASRNYYEKLKSQGRLVILHGPDIHRLLVARFRSAYHGPTKVEVGAVGGWNSLGGVHLGIMQGRDLATLYGEHGDGLFFENIRSFLGGAEVTRADRETVNQRIIKTIRHEPERMLERNNGIVVKADKVVVQPDGSLELTDAAVVNGCQTTVCLHQSRDALDDRCRVLVKVVETDQAWDIAHAANYQNEVTYFDLQLAKYLRPQLVERAASESGYAMSRRNEISSDVASLLSGLYRTHVDYSEVRLIYIGLFSSGPHNLFDSNYERLRADVLEETYRLPGTEEQIFETIFQALVAGRRAIEECERRFDEELVALFGRFGKAATYRAYLAILTLCGALADNLAERDGDGAVEAKRMASFLEQARALLEGDPQRFQRTYMQAYGVLGERALQAFEEEKADEAVRVRMSSRLKSGFTPTYRALRMRMDSDDAVHREEADPPRS